MSFTENLQDLQRKRYPPIKATALIYLFATSVLSPAVWLCFIYLNIFLIFSPKNTYAKKGTTEDLLKFQ